MNDDVERTAPHSRERLLALIAALAHKIDRRSVLRLPAEVFEAIRSALKNEAQQ